MGLKNTWVPTDYRVPTNTVKGYQELEENTGIKDYTEIDPSYVWSAGNIISNVHDVATWIKSVSTGKLLSENTKKYLLDGIEIADNVFYTAGLVNEYNKIWHNGEVIGYRAKACYFEKDDTSIAVLCNGSPDVDVVNEVVQEAVRLMKLDAE